MASAALIASRLTVSMRSWRLADWAVPRCRARDRWLQCSWIVSSMAACHRSRPMMSMITLTLLLVEACVAMGFMHARSSRVTGAWRQNTAPHRALVRASDTDFLFSDNGWVVTLDIGREKNTWMPMQWASSGTRLTLPLSVRFTRDGQAICRAVAPFFSDSRVSDGHMRAEGTWPDLTVRWDLTLTDGYERGDNSLPAGTTVYFAIKMLGSSPSNRGGLLSVLARRMLVRKERRLLGTFTMEPSTGPDADLPPARVYMDDRWCT